MPNSPGLAPACIAVAAAAITPDAGPDITVATACSATIVDDTVPPLPCITSRSRPKAARRELALQPLDVAVQHRLDRRVHRRGRAALVLAVLGDDGVARGHVPVRPEGAHDLGGPRLVRGVDVAVQEVDDDALGAEREQLLRRRRDLRLVERHQHLALGIDPLVDLEAEAPLDQRHEPALQAIGRRPGAPAELEHVAKAARRDQADGRDLALEHRVGRRRRAVDDRLERRRLDLGRVERGDHAEGLVLDRRRHLGDAHLAARRLDHDQVGEGAADVDAGDHGAPTLAAVAAALPPEGALAGLRRLGARLGRNFIR